MTFDIVKFSIESCGVVYSSSRARAITESYIHKMSVPSQTSTIRQSEDSYSSYSYDNSELQPS